MSNAAPSPAGRPKRDPFVKKNVNLDAVVVARVEQRLWDPTTRKPQYGALSTLINQLLSEWLAKGGPLPS